MGGCGARAALPRRGSVAERVSVPRPVGVSGVRVLRVLQLMLQDIFVDHVSTCHRQFAARAPEPLAYGATGAGTSVHSVTRGYALNSLSCRFSWSVILFSPFAWSVILLLPLSVSPCATRPMWCCALAPWRQAL